MCHCLHAKSDLCCASLNPAACSGRSVLRSVFDEVIEVDALDSADSVHLALMQRPELGVTFTKLHCWTLTHYSKCVFMDADTLVSRAGAVETFVSVSKTECGILPCQAAYRPMK